MAGADTTGRGVGTYSPPSTGTPAIQSGSGLPAPKAASSSPPSSSGSGGGGGGGGGSAPQPQEQVKTISGVTYKTDSSGNVKGYDARGNVIYDTSGFASLTEKMAAANAIAAGNAPGSPGFVQSREGTENALLSSYEQAVAKGFTGSYGDFTNAVQTLKTVKANPTAAQNIQAANQLLFQLKNAEATGKLPTGMTAMELERAIKTLETAKAEESGFSGVPATYGQATAQQVRFQAAVNEYEKAKMAEVNPVLKKQLEDSGFYGKPQTVTLEEIRRKAKEADIAALGQSLGIPNPSIALNYETGLKLQTREGAQATTFLTEKAIKTLGEKGEAFFPGLGTTIKVSSEPITTNISTGNVPMMSMMTREDIIRIRESQGEKFLYGYSSAKEGGEVLVFQKPQLKEGALTSTIIRPTTRTELITSRYAEIAKGAEDIQKGFENLSIGEFKPVKGTQEFFQGIANEFYKAEGAQPPLSKNPTILDRSLSPETSLYPIFLQAGAGLAELGVIATKTPELVIKTAGGVSEEVALLGALEFGTAGQKASTVGLGVVSVFSDPRQLVKLGAQTVALEYTLANAGAVAGETSETLRAIQKGGAGALTDLGKALRGSEAEVKNFGLDYVIERRPELPTPSIGRATGEAVDLSRVIPATEAPSGLYTIGGKTYLATKGIFKAEPSVLESNYRIVSGGANAENFFFESAPKPGETLAGLDYVKPVDLNALLAAPEKPILLPGVEIGESNLLGANAVQSNLFFRQPGGVVEFRTVSAEDAILRGESSLTKPVDLNKLLAPPPSKTIFLEGQAPSLPGLYTPKSSIFAREEGGVMSFRIVPREDAILRAGSSLTTKLDLNALLAPESRVVPVENPDLLNLLSFPEDYFNAANRGRSSLRAKIDLNEMLAKPGSNIINAEEAALRGLADQKATLYFRQPGGIFEIRRVPKEDAILRGETSLTKKLNLNDMIAPESRVVPAEEATLLNVREMPQEFFDARLRAKTSLTAKVNLNELLSPKTLSQLRKERGLSSLKFEEKPTEKLPSGAKEVKSGGGAAQIEITKEQPKELVKTLEKEKPSFDISDYDKQYTGEQLLAEEPRASLYRNVQPSELSPSYIAKYGSSPSPMKADFTIKYGGTAALLRSNQPGLMNKAYAEPGKMQLDYKAFTSPKAGSLSQPEQKSTLQVKENAAVSIFSAPTERIQVREKTGAATSQAVAQPQFEQVGQRTSQPTLTREAVQTRTRLLSRTSTGQEELLRVPPPGKLLFGETKTPYRERKRSRLLSLSGRRSSGKKSIIADILSATRSQARYGKATSVSTVKRPDIYGYDRGFGRVPTKELFAKGEGFKTGFSLKFGLNTNKFKKLRA